MEPGGNRIAAARPDSWRATVNLRGLSVVRIAFALVAVGLAANLIFNLVMAHRGFGYPYNIFVADPRDRFGDFFKVALGYPGPPVHALDPGWGLDKRMHVFAGQVVKFEGSPLNHFHMLPTATLIGIGLRQMIAAIDPGWAFVLTVGMMLSIVAIVAARVLPAGGGRGWMAATALIAYPTIYAIDRGHLFALICGTALIAGTARSLKLGRADWICIALFAVALNIRPNAGLIPLALFLFRTGWTFSDGVKLAVASVAMFAGAMMLANLVYPDYSLESFRRGLDDYSKLYLVRNFGQAFNSSLFGALKAMFGFHAWTFLLPIYTALALFLAGCMTAWRRPMRQSAMMFLVLSAYALGSQVFGDYHLLPFVLPVALLAREQGGDAVARWTVLLGSCAVLIPKNYIFQPGPFDSSWSWQVVINPAMLLVASVVVLVRLWRADAHDTAPNLTSATVSA
ncbi:MAG: hypothetical protein ABIQ32_03190 [Sphingomicrobium sp.]